MAQHHGKVTARQGRMGLYYRLLIQGKGKAYPRKYLVMVWQRLWSPCALPHTHVVESVKDQSTGQPCSGERSPRTHTPPDLQPRAELGHMFLRAHDTCYPCGLLPLVRGRPWTEVAVEQTDESSRLTTTGHRPGAMVFSAAGLRWERGNPGTKVAILGRGSASDLGIRSRLAREPDNLWKHSRTLHLQEKG